MRHHNENMQSVLCASHGPLPLCTPPRISATTHTVIPLSYSLGIPVSYSLGISTAHTQSIQSYSLRISSAHSHIHIHPSLNITIYWHHYSQLQHGDTLHRLIWIVKKSYPRYPQWSALEHSLVSIMIEQTHSKALQIYTASRKKRTNSILAISSSNTDRFTKFFHFYNLLEICEKAVFKYPIAPKTRHYTTLWNINVRKLACPERRGSLADI